MSRSRPQRQLLGHLRPDESAVVLERLLEAHGDLAKEAEKLAVDADITELVDDQSDAASVRLTQEVPDQAGLSGAEEAGEHGGRNLGVHEAIT
jgi:hypothetical protein